MSWLLRLLKQVVEVDVHFILFANAFKTWSTNADVLILFCAQNIQLFIFIEFLFLSALYY